MSYPPIHALNARQERFIAEYLIDLNGKAAAIRAGYAKRSAGRSACRLLRDPLVRRAVKCAMAERARRTRISADRVLKEYGLRTFEKIKGVTK